MKLWKKALACALTAASCALPLATAEAATQTLTLTGDHGQLAAVLQKPDGKEKMPLVILLHGFTGTKETPVLVELANDLEREGIATLRFDFNGHGESEGCFEDMTVPNEIEDAKHVYAYAESLPWVTSISLAGHSQGGVVTSMTAGELGTAKVKAIALLAPAAVLREDSIRGNVQGATFDPLDPPATVQLPWGDFRMGRDYILTNRDLPIYETAAQYQGPACMIHGTGDVIVPYTYSLRYDRIYFKGEVHLIDGEDHSFNHDKKEAARIAADFFKKELF